MAGLIGVAASFGLWLVGMMVGTFVRDLTDHAEHCPQCRAMEE